ncbi:MAG TPA: S8 family serine peptidase, partial [Coleofasciculaceae cyanobacterium]
MPALKSAGQLDQAEPIVDRPAHAKPQARQKLLTRSAKVNARGNPTLVGIQQTIKGALARSDVYKPQLESYIDDYQLKGIKPGQIVQVSVKSQALDANLRLIDARTHQVLLYGEDSSSYDVAPRLVFTPKAGTQYLVRVSSSQKSFSDYALDTFGKTGNYTLKIQAIAPRDDFDFFYGSGLVNAAAAVAQAIGKNLFADASAVGEDRDRLDLIKAPAAWAQGYTGQGITVAVLDGGVDYTHADLQQNIWTNPGEIADNGKDDDGNGFVDDVRGWDFTHNTNTPLDSPDDGHGTHVAGIIAAANNGTGATGVAYNAKIMPIKVIDGESTSDASLAKGIRYAVQNGARVINISLGKQPQSQVSSDLIESLQLAQRAGVVVVMAAGNRRQKLGATHPDNPAAYAATAGLGIAVGAIATNRTLFIDSNPAGSQKFAFVV